MMFPRGLAAACLVAAGLYAPAAQACGGFFCASQPVDQRGENIVFAVDRNTGSIETHVQIAYEGSAEDFAWVVPVPTVPELFVSTQELFNQLEWMTAPRFLAEYRDEGNCTGYAYDESLLDYAGGYSYSSSAPAEDSDGVVVVQEARVGPYDTVVLQAQASDALVTWLQENNYDLPSELEPVLRPYVADQAYFVALRLANDQDVGDIAPLGMRYQSEKAGIPIQLTSIAATPDMRLKVWVFGSGRAVPESYLHVRINEVAIDWTRGGANYESVITRAADEAGGHAFGTDFAGDAGDFAGTLWWDERYDVSRLAVLDDPIAFMQEIINQGFPANDALLNLLMEFLPPPEGVDPTAYYNCLDCYQGQIDASQFDPVAFAARIDEVMVQPLVDAEALFTSHAWLTRMTSSLSPAEMTVDPVFAINHDMGEVALDRNATITYECGTGRDRYDATRRVQLADGRRVRLPSSRFLDDRGMTVEDYLESLTSINALIVERTGEFGDPEIISDFTGDAWRETEGPNPDGKIAGNGGCGCVSGGAAGLGGLAWLLLAGLAIVRRRRTA